MTKNKKNELYDDSWIYILLLTTLAILLESLKSYTFKISGVNITYSIILLPIVFLIANYITKKYSYKRCVAAIAISAVISVCFMALLSFALGKNLLLSNFTGEFCAYVVSQFVNLTIYYFLLKNTKPQMILVYLNYSFSLITFTLFYTILNLNMILLDDFWTKYFIMIGIGFIINIPLTIIDNTCKRGRDIKK